MPYGITRNTNRRPRAASLAATSPAQRRRQLSDDAASVRRRPPDPPERAVRVKDEHPVFEIWSKDATERAVAGCLLTYCCRPRGGPNHDHRPHAV